MPTNKRELQEVAARILSEAGVSYEFVRLRRHEAVRFTVGGVRRTLPFPMKSQNYRTLDYFATNVKRAIRELQSGAQAQ